MPAPAPSSSRRSPLLPLYVVLALVALLGAVLIARQLSRKTTDPKANAPVPVNLTPQQLNSTPGIAQGQPNAPVTIFEFADFQCPHCAQFATMVEPVLRERMISTGKVRFVFYEFPLGGAFPWSFIAARAGRCANEQGKFWEFHDWVFGKQSDWSYEADQDKVIEHFLDYAQQVGADRGKFETCVRSSKYAQEVSQSRAFGELLQVGGTPTLFINGKRVPQTPEAYNQLEPLLNMELTGGGMRLPSQAPGGGPAAPAPAAPAPADTAKR
ncbi:MAG: putative oxidoreductase [Gemmatimonadetes bacterium]|nr:putative oxidoreductase [Gemmatimonadota bacterium]